MHRNCFREIAKKGSLKSKWPIRGFQDWVFKLGSSHVLDDLSSVSYCSLSWSRELFFQFGLHSIIIKVRLKRVSLNQFLSLPEVEAKKFLKKNDISP